MAELTALRTQAATDKATIERLEKMAQREAQAVGRLEDIMAEHSAAEATIERLTAERDAARAERDRLEQDRGAWTGRPCRACGGYGERNDDPVGGRRCPSCGGTGDEWLTWQERAEAAEAQRDALAGKVEGMTAVLEVARENLQHVFPNTSERRAKVKDAVAAIDAALSTTGEPKEPAPLTPSERARAAETVQVARAVHGAKEPCDICRGTGLKMSEIANDGEHIAVKVELCPRGCPEHPNLLPDCQGGDLRPRHAGGSGT